MNTPRILVACVGNIFLGDDGFGVEVARRLAEHPLPDGVRVTDFGIRGLDLMYALLDRSELTILVDACPRGRPPGTVCLLEPDLNAPEQADVAPGPLEMHCMNPENVLRMVRSIGGKPGRTLVVGCEPAELGGEDGKLGLSEPVEAAVGQATQLIETLVSRILDGAAVDEVLQSQ